MSKDTGRKTAAVFMSGTSQAVRLPVQYRFAAKRVLIEKQGDAVILTPAPAPESWADLCTGQPSDIEDQLEAINDNGLGPLEQRANVE